MHNLSLVEVLLQYFQMARTTWSIMTLQPWNNIFKWALLVQ